MQIQTVTLITDWPAYILPSFLQGTGHFLPNEALKQFYVCQCYKKPVMLADGIILRAAEPSYSNLHSRWLPSKFRLHIWKTFFTVRVLRYWNILLREVVDDPVLAVFKARLDKASSNLVRWKVSLPIARGL